MELKTERCNESACPTIGTYTNWGDWENWGDCSVSCGTGIYSRKRYRSCTGRESDCSWAIEADNVHLWDQDIDTCDQGTCPTCTYTTTLGYDISQN